MRNKHLVWAYLLILSIGTILSLYIPKNEVTAKEAIVIPNEAIRLRILANSDSEADQALKRLVRDEVNKNITEWVAQLTSIDDARGLIQSKLPEVQEIALQVLQEQNSKQSVKVEFGKVQFPTKLYGQFLYPAGEYEAILITLGDGDGANWWCVLYPPLCFLDFANGVAVSDGFEGERQVQASTNVPSVEVASSKEEQVEVKAKPTDEKLMQVESKNIVGKEAKDVSEPLYVKNDEQPVEVKFFVKELWEKLF